MIRNDNREGSLLARGIEQLANDTFKWAVGKGFETHCPECQGGGEYAQDGRSVQCPKCHGTGSGFRNFGEQVALVHSELSELLEAHRTKQIDEPDEHCPEFTKAEIEVADAIIRLLCMSGSYGWRIGRAIDAKRAYNEKRPPKHGKSY